MDFIKIQQEIYAEETAWHYLFYKHPALKEYLTKIDHADKERLVKLKNTFSEEQKRELIEAIDGVEESKVIKVFLSDLYKIGELATKIKGLEQEVIRLRALEAILKMAEEVYLADNERQDKRLREAAKILGWTNGKRPKKIDAQMIFLDYLGYISGNNPMEKWEALELLSKRYDVLSPGAALKHVQDYLGKLKKLAENNAAVNSPGFDSFLANSIFVKNDKGEIESKIPGILPPNYPSSKK